MIYITENEALFNELANETEQQPAPVVEKVSLEEIKTEQDSEVFDELAGILDEFMELSPEDKDSVITGIFE